MIVTTRVGSMQLSCELYGIDTLVRRKHNVGAYFERTLVCQFDRIDVVPASAHRSLVVDHGVVL